MWWIVSNRKLYLKAAGQLRKNPDQWAAYNSTGHCVITAGPGSGKTKTLTVKLARMLAEDVDEPRGIACITFNNECAKELENRLYKLGVELSNRVFIGTVHSFSLTKKSILPYAETCGLGLPKEFRVASQKKQRLALEIAFNRVIGGPGDPQKKWFSMATYRRSFLDRDRDEWLTGNPELAQLVEAYEEELRKQGLIDFDDMPLLALRALKENKWLRQAILAKYPILVVDEYQDLGRALHSIVTGLCFRTGIRLFAVGDVDQSIYGFMGATPNALKSLSNRDDVETVRLALNYRCGSNIVAASQIALGEERNYKAVEGAIDGTVYFHPGNGSYDDQANKLFSNVLPAALSRNPDLQREQVAIIYPAAWLGDIIATSAKGHGYDFLRTDANALYPRSSRMMRWLEKCGTWVCGGWREGEPRLAKIASEARHMFNETLADTNEFAIFQRSLLEFLWSSREHSTKLHVWLTGFLEDVLQEQFSGCRTLDDELVILKSFIDQTNTGNAAEEMTVGIFSGWGEGSNRINLSTLHSVKGREFTMVVMFGMDLGGIPRNNSSEKEMLEARRLFYVGFTRAENELHLMYTEHKASPFVTEVRDRVQR